MKSYSNRLEDKEPTVHLASTTEYLVNITTALPHRRYKYFSPKHSNISRNFTSVRDKDK